MSLIKRSGLNTPTIATERGWESIDGKLIISSRNLLTNRVSQNLASPEELKRWSEGQLIDLEFKMNKVLDAIDTNQLRLKLLQDKFDSIPTVDTESAAYDHIAYLQKKIEHLKIVAEYEKAFASHNQELERLRAKRDKIQARLTTVVAVVPELTEVAPKKVEPILEKIKDEPVKTEEPKKKRRFGPKPGWKKRKAEKLAAEQAALEAQKAAVEVLSYPLPPEEIVND